MTDIDFRSVELVTRTFYRLHKAWSDHAVKTANPTSPPGRLTIDHGENRKQTPFLYVASRDELVWYPRYGADGAKMVQAGLRKMRVGFDEALGTQWFSYDYRFPTVAEGETVTAYLKRCIEHLCAAFVQRAGGGS